MSFCRKSAKRNRARSMRTFETQSRKNLFVTDRTLWSFTLTHLYLGYKHVLPRKYFILSDFLSQTGTTLSDFPRSREEGIHMCWQSRFLDLGGGIPWRSIVSKGTGSITPIFISLQNLLAFSSFWLVHLCCSTRGKLFNYSTDSRVLVGPSNPA